MTWSECGNCPGMSPCNEKDEFPEAVELIARFVNAVGQAGFAVEPLYTEALAFIERNR